VTHSTPDTPYLRIVSGGQPLTPHQRRLFSILMWHALTTDLWAEGHTIDLAALHDRLDTTGRTAEWLLLNLEKIAATRVRWHSGAFPETGASGFCPLIAECAITGGVLAFRFPAQLKRFVSERRLRKLLDLRVENLFRRPFSAGIYRMLLNTADTGGTGWMPLERFLALADLDARTVPNSAAALRNKVVMPAAEEITLFSEIAVSADVRQAADAPGPEVKFAVRQKDDDRPDACLLLPGAEETALTPELAREQRFEAYKAGLVCDAATAMDDSEMAALRTGFLDSIRGNAVMMKKYEKDGFDSLAVKLAFEVYLEKMLLSEDQRDLGKFKESSG
jgi:hypothetical protein